MVKIGIYEKNFIIKLLFISLLIYITVNFGFFTAFWFISALFTLSLIFTFIIKNKFTDKIFKFIEHSYEDAFSGKQTIIILLGYILFYTIVWIAKNFLGFNEILVIIIGLIPLAYGNNIIKLFQNLYRKKLHFINDDLSVEGFILGIIINTLLFLLFLPFMPKIVITYLAIVSLLAELLHFDSNYTVPFITVLAYILFWL